MKTREAPSLARAYSCLDVFREAFIKRNRGTSSFSGGDTFGNRSAASQVPTNGGHRAMVIVDHGFRAVSNLVEDGMKITRDLGFGPVKLRHPCIIGL